jgi:hypothetical protein
MSDMMRDGSMRQNLNGGHRDPIGLTGICTIFAGAYLANKELYETIVAEAEQARCLRETWATEDERRAVVARLRRVVGTGLMRLGLTFRRDGPAGDGVGVWVSSRRRRHAEARR